MDLRLSKPLIYLSILIISVCGIIYELIIAAVSSYLWGDSVFYFSVTIGLYMSAMGLGAFFSKYLRQHLFDWFLASELLIGFLGGFSALFLFWLYSGTDLYEYGFVLVTVCIGTLVGLEIPLLIRLMETELKLRQNVANILTYDYIGGLVGALLFPVILLPYLGLIRSALLLGLLNLLVAMAHFVRHRSWLRSWPMQLFLATAACLGLSAAYVSAPELSLALEQRIYRDRVVFSRQTAYQQLTLTEWHRDLRLFINGGLQFSSLDEYRYHESLVHVAAARVPMARRALILGGGDGLAARELLKYPELKITVVDLDPEMTQLFQTEPRLRSLNQDSLSHARVQVVNQDAFKFAENDTSFYDLIYVDLPDPGTTALAKLYSQSFYALLSRRLSEYGALAVQSTSAFFAPQAYWCIHKTLQAAGFFVYPYQAEVPSFGNWGFQLASKTDFSPADLRLPRRLATRFLNQDMLSALFVLPEDLYLDLNTIQANTLMQPVILSYYQRGWNGIR